MAEIAITELEKRYEAAGWKREIVGKDAVVYIKEIPQEEGILEVDVAPPTQPSVLETIAIGALLALAAFVIVPILRDALLSLSEKLSLPKGD